MIIRTIMFIYFEGKVLPSYLFHPSRLLGTLEYILTYILIEVLKYILTYLRVSTLEISDKFIAYIMNLIFRN